MSLSPLSDGELKSYKQGFVPGLARYEIKGYEKKTASQTGNRFIVIKYEILDEENNDGMLRDCFFLTEKSSWKISSLLASIHSEDKIHTKDFLNNLDNLIGKQGICRIDNEKNKETGALFMNIKNYLKFKNNALKTEVKEVKETKTPANEISTEEGFDEDIPF